MSCEVSESVGGGGGQKAEALDLVGFLDVA